MYFPSKYPEGLWELQERLRATDVWLDTHGGVRIHAWWIPGEVSDSGNASLARERRNITYRYPQFHETAAGSSVLALDYRYGKSNGTPTERGLYRDAEAAYDYLLQMGYH